MSLSIREAVTADSYQGNAGLGGVLDASITVDTRPIQQLSVYTNARDRELYQQRQKEFEEQTAKLADVTAYDLSSAIDKDRKVIEGKWNELYSYVQKNPTVLDYRANPKGFLEYGRLKQDLDNDLRGAKTRTIQYKAIKEKISTETDPKVRELREKELNEKVESTDVRTFLPFEQQYKMSIPEMPKATGITVPLTRVHPNYIDNDELTIWGGEAAEAKSHIFGLGLEEPINENTPEGSRKAIERENNFWLRGSKIFNSAIDEYKQQHGGELDISKVKGLSKDLINISSALNAYSSKKNAEIAAGMYGANLKPYPTINIQDGITPDELALMADFASWSGDKIERKIIETDDANQAADREAANYRARLNEKGANYRANLPYEKQKASERASTDAANNFGNLIYNVNSPQATITTARGNKIPAVRFQNGVIVDKDGNPANYTEDVFVPVSYFDNAIVTEYDKYVNGNKKPNIDLQTDATTPLSKLQTDKDKKNFKVRVENGEIKGIYAEDGTLASVDQFAHITLEAGQKGATKYKRPDTEYGGNRNGVTTTGATTTTSKSSSSKTTSAAAVRALVGKAGYEGYTEKELMDYYRSQGYTIK